MQRFSNYGPRTTCGPRRLPLWSFKEDIRKNKIQMNFISDYSWKSQRLEMTHDNRLSLFSQYRHFMKFITLTIYRLSTLVSAKKESFKALLSGVSHHNLPAHLAPRLKPSQEPPESITEDQSTETFHVCMTFLIVLPTPSLHIEIFTYKLHMCILILK